MKTQTTISSIFGSRLPMFAAGVAIGAAAMFVFNRMGTATEPPPPVPDDGGGNRQHAVAEPAQPMNPDDVSPTPLSWSTVQLAPQADDRFPRFIVEANRKVFGIDATNGVPHITLFREGEQVPFKVHPPVSEDDEKSTWICLETTDTMEPGEFEIRISRDFPDPAGVPAVKDYSRRLQYAPEVLRLLAVESQAPDFSNVANSVLVFSHSIDDLASFAKYLEFSPEVSNMSLRRRDHFTAWTDDAGDRHWYGAQVDVEGDFVPGTRYSVRIRDRFVIDGDGNATLASTNTVNFLARHADRALEWLDPGLYLGGDRPLVGLRADRVPRANASVRKVLPNNLVHALAHNDDWNYDFGEWCAAPVNRVIETLAPDGIATNALDLSDFVPGDAQSLPEGLWLVTLDGKDSTNATASAEMPHISRLVAFSDTALTIRLLPTAVAAWATGISSGEPIAKASVTLYARNGEEIARAETGDDGFATLPLPKGADRPVLATVEKADGAYAFLELNYTNFSDDAVAEHADSFPESGAELDGWLGTDRGIYRHGERVQIEALVRDSTGTAPESRPVALEINRGDGVTVQRWSLVTDRFGRVSPPGGFFEIPDSQPSGPWRAILRMPEKNGRTLASRTFRVESFVPPKTRVTLSDLPDIVVPSSATDVHTDISATISGEWLFGAPAAGLKWEMSASAKAAPFQPEGWENGWTFGRKSGENGTPGQASKGTLGPDGTAAATVRLPVWTNTKLPAAALHLNVRASIYEPGGRAITTEKEVPLHVYPFYIGAKAPEQADPGREVAIPVKFAAPDGSIATSAAENVNATLFSVRESWLWEEAGGGWRWRRNRTEREIDSGVFAVAEGAATVKFTLPQGDSAYLVRMEPAGPWPESGKGTPKPCTELEFSTSGAPAAPMEGPHRLTLSTDKKSYLPGDTVKLEISSPFDGIALVTFQQRGIVDHKLVTVTDGAATVEWQAAAQHVPSVDVAASLVRAAKAGDQWPEHRAYGATRIAIDKPEARLHPALSLSTPEPIAGGGWRLSAEARIPDAGDNEEVHATFFLVDDSILGLTREPIPDPASHFARPRSSDFSLYDSFRRLLRIRDLPLLATAETGGDENAAADTPLAARRLQAARTRRFIPIALATHDVPFVDGTARTVFEVPEFSGEVRVIVLAWSRNATGAATDKRVVAPALVMEPDAPRFLAPGDSTEFVISLHSTVDEPATAAWSISAAAVLSTNGAVRLDPKGAATVRIPVKIPDDAAAGELSVAFQTEGLGETHRNTMLLPIRPALPVKVVDESMAVRPGETAIFNAASGLIAASHAEISADTAPFAAFAPAVRWLAHYPWRCLEQTTSRAFPLLASGGAALTLAPGAYADPAGELEAAVARISTMLSDGRFTMWPDSNVENPLYAARAGLFLAEAEAAGIKLSPATSENLRAALRRLVRLPNPLRKWDDSDKERIEKDIAFSAVRTTALLGLRAVGEQDADFEMSLYDRRGRISAEARAQLALCLIRGGRRDEALDLLREPATGESIPALAWKLVAWAETDLPETEDRIAELRSRLLDARCGNEWGTTEDDSAALIAAAAAIRRFGNGGGAPLVTAEADGTAPASLVDAARPVEIAPAAGAGQITIRNNGTSTALVRRIVEGLPDPSSFTANTNGIAVSRRFFDTNGNEIDPASGTISRGDVITVELAIEPWPDNSTVLEDVVVDELLPAGLEPAIAAAQSSDDAMPIVHRETRDDRIVVFARPFAGRKTFRYEAQAVSAGDFALPPTQVSEMYRPDRSGRLAPGRLVIGE